MNKAFFGLSFLLVASGCTVDDSVMGFTTGDGSTLQIQSEYLLDASGLARFIGNVATSADKDDGFVALSIPGSKLRARSHSDSIDVRLYDEPLNHKFLARNVYDFVDLGKGNVRNGREIGTCEAYVYPDWWHVIEGHCSDDDDFNIESYIADCSTFAGGQSCDVYAEWRGSHFVFSLNVANFSSRTSTVRQIASLLDSWIT